MTIKELLQGKWLGHPLHPALVHVPTGLWTSAVVFDLLATAGFGGNAMVRTSFFCILFGLLGAAAAVPAGVADFAEIKPEKRAWKIGLVHLSLNVVVTILFLLSLVLRTGARFHASTVAAAPLFLSLAGFLLMVVSGYLGGLMAYDHGIGVARQSKQKWRALAESQGARLPKEDGT